MAIAEALDIYGYVVINVWGIKDDQPQRALRGIYFIVIPRSSAATGKRH